MGSPASSGDVRAAVIGRYGGVVEVLAGWLLADGIDVTLTWAANDDTDTPMPGPDDLGDLVVVATIGPGEAALDRLRAQGWDRTVVGVTWHGDDERGDIPGPVKLVRAGAVRESLAPAVVEVGASGADG